jgi:hypothetical protein
MLRVRFRLVVIANGAGKKRVPEEFTWEQLIQRAQRRHFAHFYGSDDEALAQRVTLFLAEGMARAEGALVVATPAHHQAFLEHLARPCPQTRSAPRDGDIVFIAAQEMLAHISVNGQPEWGLFESVLTAALRSARGERSFRNVRVFGEMVGLLRFDGPPSDAQRLEGFWHRLFAAQRFDLYLAYPVDVFSEDFRLGPIDRILSGHAQLVPTAVDGRLEDAVQSAMREVLHSRSEAIDRLMKQKLLAARPTLPAGEAAILWLRNNLPEQAELILARARSHYEKERGVGGGADSSGSA